jgi:hypothetical protein
VVGVIDLFAGSGNAPAHLPVEESNFPGGQSETGVIALFAGSGNAPAHLPVEESNFPGGQSETGVTALVGSGALCAEHTGTRASPNKSTNPMKTIANFFILLSFPE